RNRALLRLTRDLPVLLTGLLAGETEPARLLLAMDIMDEVGPAEYEEFLQNQMLSSDPSVRGRARELLEKTDAFKMAPVLRLYSLGAMTTWVGERRIPDKGWAGRIPANLLAYLARHQGEFLSQDHLIDVF